MQVSVITPTEERPQFLNKAYGFLKRQTYRDWEWLIYDTSLDPVQFSDPRITYLHDEKRISIGEKRKRLAHLAKGRILVHFDDDDFYASTYLATAVEMLKTCDFFTYHSWFSFDLKTCQLFYWASDEPSEKYFMLNSLTGTKVTEIEIGPQLAKQKELIRTQATIGYGFSFAYRKEVALKCFFPDLDLGEDWQFYQNVLAAGFRIEMQPEREGRVVHMIHDSNTSSEYPQYRIPLFLVKENFKEFFADLKN